MTSPCIVHCRCLNQFHISKWKKIPDHFLATELSLFHLPGFFFSSVNLSTDSLNCFRNIVNRWRFYKRRSLRVLFCFSENPHINVWCWRSRSRPLPTYAPTVSSHREGLSITGHFQKEVSFAVYMLSFSEIPEDYAR